VSRRGNDEQEKTGRDRARFSTMSTMGERSGTLLHTQGGGETPNGWSRQEDPEDLDDVGESDQGEEEE